MRRLARLIPIVTLALSWSAEAQSIEEPGFMRFTGDSEWGYSVVPDPTGLAPVPMVERFELRPGDCTSVPPYDDCSLGAERAERAQTHRPSEAVSRSEWYRWNIFFPKDFVNTYPARTRHGQFFDHSGQDPIWTLEVGSTGVLWLGAQLVEEALYFSLIDENQLRGKWHEIVVHAVWSSDDGGIEVWANGKKKASYQGRTCVRCRVFFSYGVHRIGVSLFQKKFPGSKLPVQVVFYTEPEATTVDPHWITLPPDPKLEKKSKIIQKAGELSSDSTSPVVQSKALSDGVGANLDPIEISEPVADDTEPIKSSSPAETSPSTDQKTETEKWSEDDLPEGGEAHGDNQ